jgi:tetratricopeptide (TPR) repeat protein
VCAIAGVAGFFATRSPTHDTAVVQPVEPLRIKLSTRGDDKTLGVAIANMMYRGLRDVPDRRFWIIETADPAARGIEIRFQIVTDGIRLEAYDGATPLASANAASVQEAVDALAPPLADAVGRGRENPGPDAKERARMAKLGARTYEQFRAYRKLSEEVRVPGWFDGTEAIAGFEAMVAADPAWGHPYAELNWLYGRSTPKAKAILAAANAKVDPKRGAGLALVRALDTEVARTLAAGQHVITTLEPVFRADDQDLLAGEVLSSAYTLAGRDDEAFAIIRRLFELEPWLFYAGDVVDDLHKQGREDDARRVLDDTLARFPDSLTAMRTKVKLEALRPDDPLQRSARSTVELMRLLHGERTLVLAELYEAMVAVSDLTGAQRVADRMLRGSPLEHGDHRGAIAAAHQMAKLAWAEVLPFGREGERDQTFQLMVSLGPLVGEREATIATLEEHAGAVEKLKLHESAAGMRFSAALMKRGASCPTIDRFLAPLASDSRAGVRRMLRRAAAQVGCARCEDVVADGFSGTETSAESLLAFGRCARVTGQLDLARRAFERAAAMWSSWNNALASPVHAILAWYELGLVETALKNTVGAREAFRRFLRAWGRPDRALPEVADAQRILATLR